MNTRFLVLLLPVASGFLAGCASCKDTDSPPIDTSEPLEDRDGDGWNLRFDCDDTSPAIHPEATDPYFDGVDQDCDRQDGTAWTSAGERADEGLGSSLAWLADGSLAVGAPHGETGRVYKSGPGTLEILLEGTERDLLGSGLASHGTGAVVGAPWRTGEAGGLAGAVLDLAGTVLAEGADEGTLLGGRLASDGSLWAATTARGWRTPTTEGTPSDSPASLALVGGAVRVGMAWGQNAVEGGPVPIPRTTAAGVALLSEAGRSVASGDLDGDGAVDLAVGDPSWARVMVYLGEDPGEAHVLEGGSGRFGHALAIADLDLDGTQDLAVGAPTSGEQMEGVVWVFLGPLRGDLDTEDASWSATGSEPWGSLGQALAATAGRLAAGAPGGEGTAGAVQAWSATGPVPTD